MIYHLLLKLLIANFACTMALQPAVAYVLVMFSLLYGCCGQDISLYIITPDPGTSCGEDHEPCLTLDQFASKNLSNSSAKLILIPGQHNLTQSIQIVGVDNISILANTSVTI